MTRVYYKDAHGAIVMFDLSKACTFEGALKWKNDIDSKCRLLDGSSIPCLLLGNKSDLRIMDVGSDRIEQMSNKSNFVGWASASVKSNVFVEDAVTFLIENVLQRLSFAETIANTESLDSPLKLQRTSGPIIKVRDSTDHNLSMSVISNNSDKNKKKDQCC